MTVHPSSFESEVDTIQRLDRFVNWHELMNEGHSLVRCIHEKSSCFIISAAGLNTSPKLRTYIRSLSNSSSTSVLWCLVFGRASSLDAFSSYPSGRGYPALPCQTTGKLVAPSPRSSRTEGPLPSDTKHFNHQATNLSHDGLNPSHDPF